MSVHGTIESLEGSLRAAGLGSSERRREDHRLLTGRGRFLDDLDLGDTYEAAILRSPYPSARIHGIDAARARCALGVVAVFTASDVGPILQDLPPKVTHPDLRHEVRYPVATDAVRYVGEPVGVVVAVSRALAEDAAELVEVDYEPLPGIGSTAAALASGAVLVHAGSTGNVAVNIVQKAGDPDAALAAAPHVLRETFVVTRGGGHSMEGRAIASRYDTATRELTVWDSTQTPHYVRQTLSRIYGMREEDIRVVAPLDIGGGFGPKAQLYGEEVLIPWIAMRLGATVKWVEDRAENFVSSTMERSQTHRVEVGFDDDGRLLVMKDVFEHDQGAYCVGLQVPTITLSTIPGPYRVPNIHTEVVACYTNMVPTSSLRGAGRPQAVVVMERMVDRIAEHLGLEGAEVRRRNLIQPEEFPYAVGLRFRDGSPLTYDSGDYPALLEGALVRIGAASFRRDQLAARARGSFVGLGLAMFVEGTGLGPYEGARVRLTGDGRILVALAASPQGQGYETVYAQLASHVLGVDLELVEVRHGDTSLVPFGQGTFASRVTATAGPAVLEACTQLRADLLAAGAHLLEADAADVYLQDDAVRTYFDTARAVTLQDIAARSNIGRHGMSVPRGFPVALERVAYFTPERAAYSSGVCAVVVEVDVETGVVNVLRSVVGHDCGNVLNPLLVDGQTYGGFAHGLGNALYELPCYGEDGQPLTTSYLDYSLPSAWEVPKPELFHVVSPSPLNPLGVKGAGEGGLIPVPAAVANAVEDALRPFGTRVTELPLTPSRVLRAIGGGRGS